MGFLSSLFGGNKTQEFTLHSPINGEVLEAKAIPDETFSECILGPTICLKADADGTVYSPCDGTVSQIFKTAHAVTVTSNEGVEVLIHVGIDTVNLEGKGFEALVKDDDKVTSGQALIKFDRAVIKEAGYSDLIPMVICNAMDYKDCKFVEPKAISTQDVICTITPKE